MSPRDQILSIFLSRRIVVAVRYSVSGWVIRTTNDPVDNTLPPSDIPPRTFRKAGGIAAESIGNMNQDRFLR